VLALLAAAAVEEVVLQPALGGCRRLVGFLFEQVAMQPPKLEPLRPLLITVIC